MRKADFRQRPDGTRYLHLCWQASENGRELEPLKHRKAGDFRDVPVPGAMMNARWTSKPAPASNRA